MSSFLIKFKLKTNLVLYFLNPWPFLKRIIRLDDKLFKKRQMLTGIDNVIL